MSKWVLAARLIGVGFFIGGAIILGVVIGLWLDRQFNTKIIWLIGLLLGIVMAFWGVYQMLIPLLSNKDNHNGRNH